MTILGQGVIVGWRVWVDTPTGVVVYASRTSAYADLPDDGWLVQMLYYADGRTRILEGADYYFQAQHLEGPIYGTAMTPPDPRRYVHPLVKRGQWVPDHVMARVETAALASRWDD